LKSSSCASNDLDQQRRARQAAQVRCDVDARVGDRRDVPAGTLAWQRPRLRHPLAIVARRCVRRLGPTGWEIALVACGLAGDGGLAAGGALETGPGRARPARFTARPWPAERLAGIDELHEPGRILVDARDRDRYSGEFEPVDPRPGHIPGARNLPAREMLDADGRLLPPDVVRAQLADAGVSGEVVASCGSGVNACHTLLVVEALGLPPGRLFPGSYSQWSHTDRPVEPAPESRPVVNARLFDPHS
jgi:thiosulfate/3-mercaptopyruvate sulfurtransferase